MDALTAEQARRLVGEWERDPDHESACEFFRSGSFDLEYGEHRCRRCGVPQQTHKAYRLLNTMVMTHG